MMAALFLTFVLVFTLSELHAQKQYAEDTSQLQQQYDALEKSEKELEANEKELEEKNRQAEEDAKTIDDQRKQLYQLIGVKAEIVEQLQKEFNDSGMEVKVDSKTGAITLDSSILFDFNKYELKDSGKKFLKKFVPKYLSVLLNEDNKQYIAEIIIEGHTDTKGSYLTNLDLSQKRALSVVTYCLDPDNKIMDKKMIKEMRSILTANGRSYSDPIYKADGSVDMAASRRVEFKFRLKDDEMIDEMAKVLEGAGE